MKKITLFLLLLVVMVLSSEAHKYRNRDSQITISIQTFYDQLSPYGDWIFTPDYGYVWRPYFDSPENFRPYSSAGNWVYTSFGWTWVSDYNWGWAVFHYGRWNFDEYLGWTWIPGYEWAPAWVIWGSYYNYWGWAPMGPDIYALNNTNWYAPDPWWTFIPRNQFCSDNWNNYIYDRPVHVYNINIINNIYVDNTDNDRNRNSWYHGPRVSDVERYSRNRVRTMEITESQRPENMGVRNDRLNIYRPVVDKSRTENRPFEYRNVESARTERRIDQTNPRTNYPGINRTRANGNETQSATQRPVRRNDNLSRESRIDPAAPGQLPNRGTNQVVRESQVTTRTASTTEPRTGSVNREARVEPTTRLQVAPGRNSTLPSFEPKRENPVRENKVSINYRTSSSPIPAKVERTDKVEPINARNNAPSRENVNYNTVRGNENRQVPVIQSSREQRIQNTTPGSVSRSENSERIQPARVAASQDGSRMSDQSGERSTTGNPNRR